MNTFPVSLNKENKKCIHDYQYGDLESPDNFIELCRNDQQKYL